MENNISQVSWPGWEVVRRIGSGSFGTVYEIQRDVYGDIEKAALKVIRIPHSEDEVDYLRCSGVDDESITRTFHQQVGDIAREYKLMSQIKENPNVVRCDDFRDIQHDDGFGWDIYIKMELLTPLMKALDHLKTETQIIQLGKDICNALVACQARNIIHRDIKPQNVFLSDSGRFKLGDFGIARTIEHTTRATAGIGTYSYMAPEVEKKQAYNMSADIYSLGLMLYWLLNARRSPFMPLPPEVPKYDDEEKARQRRFSGEQIPAPKNGSKQLKAIVLKACAYDPKDRYASAAAMLEDLNKLTGGSAAIPPFMISDEKDDEKQEDKTTDPVFDTAQNDNVVDDDWDATVGPSFAVKTSSIEKPETEGPKSTNPSVAKEKGKRSVLKYVLIVLGIVMVIVFLLLLMRSCGSGNQVTQTQQTTKCAHQWTNATCTSPVTCLLCGESSGVANGHTWQVATCTSAATCIFCHEEFGIPKGHSWVAATKEAPMTCIICGQTEGVPVPKNIAIASSAYTIVVLKSDGTVNAIGASDGRTDVANWQDIVAIAAGSMHTVGVKKDGSVVAVGYNEYGQCNVSGWSDITAVSASGSHTVGLKSDGTVVATGSNLYGECNVSDWSNIIAVSAGAQNTVGVKSDGTVVFTGREAHDNFKGLPKWSNITSVVATQRTTIGLRSDGTVIATGDNGYGQCDVSHWSNIIAIAADEWHTVGLKADGTVVVAGSNKFGQLSKVNGWRNVVAVSAGVGHTACLLSEGTVVTSGRNGGGEWDLSELN